MLQPLVTPSTVSLYSQSGEGSITTWLTLSRAWTSSHWSFTQQQVHPFLSRYRFVLCFLQTKLAMALYIDKPSDRLEPHTLKRLTLFS